jgi:hypothetical protein
VWSVSDPSKLDLRAGELHRDGLKIRLQERLDQLLKMTK